MSLASFSKLCVSEILSFIKTNDTGVGAIKSRNLTLKPEFIINAVIYGSPKGSYMHTFYSTCFPVISRSFSLLSRDNKTINLRSRENKTIV